MVNKVQKFNKKKIVDVLGITSSIALTLTLIFNIYYYSVYYIPTKKKYNKSNVFLNNEICISDLETKKITKQIEESLNIKITDDEIEDYLLLDAILKNEEFEGKQKWLCDCLFALLNENHYINKEEVYSSLLNVSVSYKKRPLLFKKSINGVHNYLFNSIGVFNGEEDLETLFHETIHCIFMNRTNNLPVFFKEGVTQLLTKEYMKEDPFLHKNSYVFEVAAVKMLCELTSADVVLKAFTLGDINYIIDALVESGVKKDIANKAINLIEAATKAYSLNESFEYSSGKFYVDCLRPLEICIDKKFEYDHPNSKSFYYNEMLFYNCLFKEAAILRYNLDLDKYGVDYKAYFSKELKQQILNGEYNLKTNSLTLTK